MESFQRSGSLPSQDQDEDEEDEEEEEENDEPGLGDGDSDEDADDSWRINAETATALRYLCNHSVPTPLAAGVRFAEAQESTSLDQFRTPEDQKSLLVDVPDIFDLSYSGAGESRRLMQVRGGWIACCSSYGCRPCAG